LSDALFAAVVALDLGLLYRYLKGRAARAAGEAGALGPGSRELPAGGPEG